MSGKKILKLSCSGGSGDETSYTQSLNITVTLQAPVVLILTSTVESSTVTVRIGRITEEGHVIGKMSERVLPA